jgi:hypothetical protein
MPSWREEYAQALDERDAREKASYERISEDFIDACEQSGFLFVSIPNEI